MILGFAITKRFLCSLGDGNSTFICAWPYLILNIIISKPTFWMSRNNFEFEIQFLIRNTMSSLLLPWWRQFDPEFKSVWNFGSLFLLNPLKLFQNFMKTKGEVKWSTGMHWAINYRSQLSKCYENHCEFETQFWMITPGSLVVEDNFLQDSNTFGIRAHFSLLNSYQKLPGTKWNKAKGSSQSKGNTLQLAKPTLWMSQTDSEFEIQFWMIAPGTPRCWSCWWR